MVSLKDKLVNMDYFGSQFQFSIMGSSKFKSIVGVLVSNCCLIMIIITCILFGGDFYNKENPRIVTENVQTEDSRVLDVTPSNFTFAFRITDINGNYAPVISSLLKINIFHYKYTYNETTQKMDSLGYFLKSVQCNKNLAPDIKFSKGKDLSEYKCLDFPEEGFKFGGSMNEKYFGYFYLQLSKTFHYFDTAKSKNKIGRAHV